MTSFALAILIATFLNLSDAAATVFVACDDSCWGTVNLDTLQFTAIRTNAFSGVIPHAVTFRSSFDRMYATVDAGGTDELATIDRFTASVNSIDLHSTSSMGLAFDNTNHILYAIAIINAEGFR
jgi:hypothetical protein